MQKKSEVRIIDETAVTTMFRVTVTGHDQQRNKNLCVLWRSWGMGMVLSTRVLVVCRIKHVWHEDVALFCNRAHYHVSAAVHMISFEPFPKAIAVLCVKQETSKTLFEQTCWEFIEMMMG